jgi:nucleotidyltransferase/DNA polymerase involved in DNA repair
MDWDNRHGTASASPFENVRREARYRWEENFVGYGKMEVMFIYCDTNASYASIHQYLEEGQGKPCVVANGNVWGEADAGSCLAISYEARAAGVKRGASLLGAKSAVKDLVVYESCLPLYELYGELYDRVLEWIVPRNICVRGSCDEVVVRVEREKFPIKDFEVTCERTLSYIRDEASVEFPLRIEPDQRKAIEGLGVWEQTIYALCYLIRDAVSHVLGLPISIGVAPSVALGKALVDRAKPIAIHRDKRTYLTEHDGIFFPREAKEANAFLRGMPLSGLCGIQVIAGRLRDHGIGRVGDLQDTFGLDETIRLSRNKHLGEVLWYSCHGRDDVLPGYLQTIRRGFGWG